jgi:RNA polymerase sigma-70 factor (ECF subfamily)
MTVQQPPCRDRSLIAAVGEGSVESFEALYERYVDRAYRVAYAVCHDEDRAQEAVQEAFLSVWQGSASFSAQRGTVGVWLMAIVRHRAIDVVRRYGRHAGHRAGAEGLLRLPTGAEPCDVALHREADDELLSSLARLPAAQQEVLALAFFGQLSHREIARALDLAPGTVKGRMRLGLDKLRDTVEHP